MDIALSKRQQNALNAAIAAVRARTTRIPEAPLRQALTLLGGNAARVGEAFGVSRQEIHSLISFYAIDVKELRDVSRRKHRVLWKVPQTLLEDFPDMTEGFIEEFEREASEITRRYLRGQTSQRTSGKRAGLTAEKVMAILTLNDGSITGTARDLLVATPSILYWVDQYDLRAKMEALSSVEVTRVPWPLPDAVIRAVHEVHETTGISRPHAFTRIIRGIQARRVTQMLQGPEKAAKATPRTGSSRPKAQD